MFQYIADPMILLNAGATTVTVDGTPGTGWCEFCWNTEYLLYAKHYVQYAQ